MAKDFITSIKSRISLLGVPPERILNMDQSPVWYSMDPRKTIERVNTRTIDIRTSSSSTKRVTVAITITAAGKLLRPMLVFKGARTPRARLRKRLSEMSNDHAVYTVQKNAWMDEEVMLEWIELVNFQNMLLFFVLKTQKVLKPAMASLPGDPLDPVLILLDSYRCHMMKSVVNQISDLGVIVEHIPGGCTCHVQPVDVGIGKPLKDAVRSQWNYWAVSQLRQEELSIQPRKLREPTHAEVGEWVITSLNSLSSQSIQNSWRKTNFSYFD